MSASDVNGARSRGLRVPPRPRGNWIVVALDPPCFRLPVVVTYLQSNCVKEDLDERGSHTHGNTQLRRTDGSQAIGSWHATRARACAERPPRTRWGRAVSGAAREHDQRLRPRAARAAAGPLDTHVPQDAPGPEQPRRRPAGPLLRPVLEPRRDRGTVGARSSHVGSPSTAKRPRVEPARDMGRAPARLHRALSRAPAGHRAGDSDASVGPGGDQAPRPDPPPHRGASNESPRGGRDGQARPRVPQLLRLLVLVPPFAR
jgi:hypothetical protein